MVVGPVRPHWLIPAARNSRETLVRHPRKPPPLTLRARVCYTALGRAGRDRAHPMASLEASTAQLLATARRRLRWRAWADTLLTIAAAAALGAALRVADEAVLLRLAAAPSVAARSPAPTAEPQIALVAFRPPVQAEEGLAVAGEADQEATRDGLNDLQQRVERVRRTLPQGIPGRRVAGLLYVDLEAAADLLEGEVVRGAGPQQDAFGLITAEGLTLLRPGDAEAVVNEEPVALGAPARVGEHGLDVPAEGLVRLYGMGLGTDAETGLDLLTAGTKRALVLTKEGAFRIEICRSGRWIKVWFAGRMVREYPACTGAGENTPTGHFRIVSKAVWPGWRSYEGEYIPSGSRRNPLGARFLGTSAHGRHTGWPIGIHGTNDPSSIGRRISGGCVRTFNSYAIELYETIPLGTPVDIHE